MFGNNMSDKNTCCSFTVKLVPLLECLKIIQNWICIYPFNVSRVSLNVKPPNCLKGFLQSFPFFSKYVDDVQMSKNGSFPVQ